MSSAEGEVEQMRPKSTRKSTCTCSIVIMCKALGLVPSSTHQSGKPEVRETSHLVCRADSAGQEDSGLDSVTSTHTSPSQFFLSHFVPAGMFDLTNDIT